jgi:hypothetical protein
VWVLRGFRPDGDGPVSSHELVDAEDEDVRRLLALPAADPLVFVYPVAADLVRELADQFDVALTGPPQVYFLYADADRR